MFRWKLRGPTPVPRGLTLASVLIPFLTLLLPALPIAAQEESAAPVTIEIPDPDSIADVTGTVVDHATGDSLYGASVSLATGPGGTPGVGTRVTNQNGRFRFQGVPAGTYRLSVNLLGYGTLWETLTVAGGSNLQVILKLSVSPVELDPIEVVAERRRRGPLADFERRRELGLGTYFDREDIEARSPYVLTDLLRTIPGVRVTPAGQFGDKVVRFRGSCRPEVIVDGVRTSIASDIDHVLMPMDVEAVEVYKGAQLPMRFGTNPCGAIVVWTRVPDVPEGEGITWRQIGTAAGFILLALIATR